MCINSVNVNIKSRTYSTCISYSNSLSKDFLMVTCFSSGMVKDGFSTSESQSYKNPKLSFSKACLISY